MNEHAIIHNMDLRNTDYFQLCYVMTIHELVVFFLHLDPSNNRNISQSNVCNKMNDSNDVLLHFLLHHSRNSKIEQQGNPIRKKKKILNYEINKFILLFANSALTLTFIKNNILFSFTFTYLN